MKNTDLHIRLSFEDMQTIRRKAHDAKMNISQYVLSAALDKPIVIIDGVREFNKELRRIGVNLNQIAVLCNMGKIKCANIKDAEEAMLKIYKEINRLRKDIRTQKKEK